MQEQDEIRAAAALANDKIRRLCRDLEVAHAELRVVMARCTHPDRFKTTVMGDSGTRCPDCGHST